MTKIRAAALGAITFLAAAAALDESNVVGLVARKAIALIQQFLAFTQ